MISSASLVLYSFQIPQHIFLQQMLRVDPRMVFFQIMSKIPKRLLHYFPQPSSRMLPPGWQFRQVVTSYTTPWRLSHAELAVLCCASSSHDIVRGSTALCPSMTFKQVWWDLPWRPTRSIPAPRSVCSFFLPKVGLGGPIYGLSPFKVIFILFLSNPLIQNTNYYAGRLVYNSDLMQPSLKADDLLNKLLLRCPEEGAKVSRLFMLPKNNTVSEWHRDRNILTNANELFNMLQSNFLLALKQQDATEYYELKKEVYCMIVWFIQKFPLNAKGIHEETFLVVRNNRRDNFLMYLIKDVREAYEQERKTTDNKLKHICDGFRETATTVFFLLCKQCTMQFSELFGITQTLTDFYYSEQLTTRLLEVGFALVEAGLRQRDIVPYLYFLDFTKNQCIRVLFSNSKFPFGKGMTVFTWLLCLKRTQSKIFWLKTNDGNELILWLKEGKLWLQCHQQQNQSQQVEISDFPLDIPTMLGIQLEPSSEGLFKSAVFLLNITLNGKTHRDIARKIPRFATSQFISECSLFHNFIGMVYSIIICTRPEMNAYEQLSKLSPNGVASEGSVWKLIEMRILKNENIICIFNCERVFQGLLLNFVSEKNHACFQGKISKVKYHQSDAKLVDIYLPFLYLLTLVEPKDELWSKQFDMVTKHIIKVATQQHGSTEVEQSLLFVLYFLQMNKYPISQQTLTYLYDQHATCQSFNLRLVIKCLDIHQLVQLGYTVPNGIQNDIDPVQKTMLLFKLQDCWQSKWNELQGFRGWWSPTFFSPQQDGPYDPRMYKFDAKKEHRVKWGVMNLIGNNYCRCLLEPIFTIPVSARLTRYHEEYRKKECFNQEFVLNLWNPQSNLRLVCSKVSKSVFDRVKGKLGLEKEPEERAVKAEQKYKEMSTECLHIDLLTIVIGILQITKDGVLMFTPRHNRKEYDHMCVKAFTNDHFVCFSLPLKDIRQVRRKRFNASNNAVSIKTKETRQILLYFANNSADKFFAQLEGIVTVQKDAYLCYLESTKPAEWIDKAISNFQYLQWLNEIAGRNYSDITQYPVLPWVYISNQLNSQQQYRDLTKNMGSHGDETRLKYFLQKYESNSEEELFNQYHFGTHYSSSAIIFNFLIRLLPYSSGALALQSGKYDCADRIFYSYFGSWINATTSPTDIRELIPEMYTLPEMFFNKNNQDYGLTQLKEPIDNVQLPKWCNDNPYDFVTVMRRQLESPAVSDRIHKWIDLIYGCKQRGKEAIQSMNIFYPLTYESAIDLSKVESSDEKISFETQIAHFGQNPSQIIGKSPHPSRMKTKTKWEGKLVPDAAEIVIQKCFLTDQSQKEDKFLFKSVFEGQKSILSIKFIDDFSFVVLRKHNYYLFKILNKKADFLSKQAEINYNLQSCEVSLDYKALTNYVPVSAISADIVLVAGFHNGYTQVIFLKQSRYNRSMQFPMATITSINFNSLDSMLYLGDNEGSLQVYSVSIRSKEIEFQQVTVMRQHDSKINSISVNLKANLFTSSSTDGSIRIYNLYSHKLVRVLQHPSGYSVNYCEISTSPLHAILFYSQEDNLIYSYSINGQYLCAIIEKTGFIYGLFVLPCSDSTESLIYLNASRQLFIEELPMLKMKRKIKLKKDQFRISCFECCHNGKISIAGSEDGALQIIANPAAY